MSNPFKASYNCFDLSPHKRTVASCDYNKISKDTRRNKVLMPHTR